jgi:polyferredoxin
MGLNLFIYLILTAFAMYYMYVVFLLLGVIKIPDKKLTWSIFLPFYVWRKLYNTKK